MKFVPALAVALIALSTSAASAADMYVKARPMVPTWDWSGFYAGVNVGAGIPDSPTDNTVTDPTAPTPLVLRSIGSESRASVIGGVQAGYNKVVAPWLLVGIEVDAQGADLRSRNFVNDDGGQGPGSFVSLESRLNWFGTVRGRLGYIASPSTLIYATGGLAYGEVELTNSNFSSIGAIARSTALRDTRTGWTAGGGIETRLWDSNWTAKAEYLYMDLGSAGASTLYGVGGFVQTTNADFQYHIVRAGLNYKFGW